MAKERNPVFVAAENWLIKNPFKPDGKKNTIQDWYKASGYDPKENRPLKNRARAGQPPSITYRNYAQEKGSGQRRLGRIRESKKAVNSAIRLEAAAQWDELVGDRSKTINIKNRTYTFEQYLNKEVRDHSRLTKQKAAEAVDLEKSLGHGTPTTDTPRYAESYTQQFAEDPSGNYSSQDYTPPDQTERLRRAGLAGSPEEAAKLHVGTTDIGGRLPDTEIENVLKAKPEPEVLKQIRIQNMRKLAGVSAAAGLTGISILGTGASAAETKTRTDIASETGDLADKIQAGISGLSLAADVASYNPVAAIPGAIISTGADALNIGIDMFRQGATHQRIRGRSGAKKQLSTQ